MAPEQTMCCVSLQQLLGLALIFLFEIHNIVGYFYFIKTNTKKLSQNVCNENALQLKVTQEHIIAECTKNRLIDNSAHIQQTYMFFMSGIFFYHI